MGFDVTVTGAALADTAQWAAALAPRRPTEPAIAGVLIVADEFEGGTLSFSATDHNTTGRIEVPDPAVAGGGRRLVSARLLADIARTVAKEPQVTLVDNDDGNRLDVTAGRGGSWSIPLMPAEDFPRLPQPVTPVARVDAAGFARAVERASLALSEPESQPFHGGIMLDTADGAMSIVAGSPYRMAIVDLDWTAVGDALAEPGFARVLVPGPVLAALIGAARGADGEITLHSDGSVFAASGPGFHVIGRVHADPPEKWRGGDMVTRLEYRIGHADVAADALRTALDRVAVALEPHEAIKVEVRAEGIAVSSSQSTKAAAVHEVDVLAFEGQECCYGLNLGYTRDMLACLAAKTVRLEFVGRPRSPMTLARALDDENGELLTGVRMNLAPVRLPGTAKAKAS